MSIKERYAEMREKRRVSKKEGRKESMLKRNNLPVSEFDALHVEPTCKIVPVFVTIDRGGGAINYGLVKEEDYASDAYVYHDKCEGHDVISANYSLLSPIGTG